MAVNGINRSIQDLNRLESHASGQSVIHRLSPTCKVIFTIIYIMTVVSFPKYDWIGLLPFFAYPLAVIIITGLSLRLFSRRLAVVLPFVFLAGIANVFLDKSPVPLIGGVVFSGGIISFLVLFLKAFLSVGAVLILAATTPMNMIAGGLYKLKFPDLLIIQILLLWHYLGLVTEEAAVMTDAYHLRSRHSTVWFKDWPFFTGQLLLRSLNRSTHIHQAMQCRLFSVNTMLPKDNSKISFKDVIVCIFGMALCLFLRFWERYI